MRPQYRVFKRQCSDSERFCCDALAVHGVQADMSLILGRMQYTMALDTVDLVEIALGKKTTVSLREEESLCSVAIQAKLSRSSQLSTWI